MVLSICLKGTPWSSIGWNFHLAVLLKLRGDLLDIDLTRGNSELSCEYFSWATPTARLRLLYRCGLVWHNGLKSLPLPWLFFISAIVLVIFSVELSLVVTQRIILAVIAISIYVLVGVLQVRDLVHRGLDLLVFVFPSESGCLRSGRVSIFNPILCFTFDGLFFLCSRSFFQSATGFFQNCCFLLVLFHFEVDSHPACMTVSAVWEIELLVIAARARLGISVPFGDPLVYPEITYELFSMSGFRDFEACS